MREKIVPFIDSLPEIDWSIVGAEAPKFGGDICLSCLASREAARIDGQSIPGMTPTNKIYLHPLRKRL